MEVQKRKLTCFFVHPNIYTDYMLRAISKLPEFDLMVYFNEGLMADYPWKTKMGEGFDNEIIKNKSRVDWPVIKSTLANKDGEILIAGWNNPTFFLLATILCLRGRKFSFWTDTPNVDQVRNPVKTVLRNAWLKMLFKGVKHFFVTGNAGINAAKRMGVPEEKLVNFPFATDIEKFGFKPKEKDYAKMPVRFISTGRLDNGHKGHDLAIKALARLRDEGLANFVYEIAGEGEDRPILEQLIEEKKLNENVNLLGWLEPSDLLGFYHNGDILLHTSHFDPFPNAVLEAMACGVPVVGSDKAGSVYDRVEDGFNGYRHVSGDQESVYQAIKKILENRNRIKEMGKNARATAEKWSIDYHLNVIKSVFGA